MSDSLQEIKEMIGVQPKKHKNKMGRTYIIQKYLEKPLLYQKRKFDIRCYVLLTVQRGEWKAYWYKDGYIRTSGYVYSLECLSDKMIHLTNDAVQKKSEDYGKFESQNKVSF